MTPAAPPFPEDVQASFDAIMGGKPPLLLFTTLAREPRLFRKLFSASLLERGHLTLRQREIVIHRTTALCGSEYEWSVHAATYATRAAIEADQLRSTVHGGAQDACWSAEDRLLLRMCDALHADCTLDDSLWQELKRGFSDEALLELLMLAGLYRLISYLTNALRLPLESDAVRFPTA